MKRKRNLIQSIIKDVKKGFKRIFWYTFCKTNYFFLSLKYKIKKENIEKFNISLLLPTRERSEKYKRMLSTLIDTCNDLDRIELLILLDSDDKELNIYKEIINQNVAKGIDIKIFVNNLDTHAKRNNYLAKKSNGKILFPINDDIIFKSKNWDNYIDTEFSKVKNTPYSLWLDHGQKYKYLHCDFPIVNRIWYEKLGYIGSEYFNFWYLDTWICDLSLKSKKFLITNKIKLYQYSAHTLKEEVDNTHLKNIKNDIPEKDYVIWNNTEFNRINDAKLLK